MGHHLAVKFIYFAEYRTLSPRNALPLALGATVVISSFQAILLRDLHNVFPRVETLIVEHIVQRLAEDFPDNRTRGDARADEVVAVDSKILQCHRLALLEDPLAGLGDHVYILQLLVPEVFALCQSIRSADENKIVKSFWTYTADQLSNRLLFRRYPVIVILHQRLYRAYRIVVQLQPPQDVHGHFRTLLGVPAEMVNSLIICRAA